MKRMMLFMVTVISATSLWADPITTEMEQLFEVFKKSIESTNEAKTYYLQRLAEQQAFWESTLSILSPLHNTSPEPEAGIGIIGLVNLSNGLEVVKISDELEPSSGTNGVYFDPMFPNFDNKTNQLFNCMQQVIQSIHEEEHSVLGIAYRSSANASIQAIQIDFSSLAGQITASQSTCPELVPFFSAIEEIKKTASVPEPSMVSMIVPGLLFFLIFRRKSKKQGF